MTGQSPGLPGKVLTVIAAEGILPVQVLERFLCGYLLGGLNAPSPEGFIGGDENVEAVLPSAQNIAAKSSDNDTAFPGSIVLDDPTLGVKYGMIISQKSNSSGSLLPVKSLHKDRAAGLTGFPLK